MILQVCISVRKKKESHICCLSWTISNKCSTVNTKTLSPIFWLVSSQNAFLGFPRIFFASPARTRFETNTAFAWFQTSLFGTGFETNALKDVRGVLPMSCRMRNRSDGFCEVRRSFNLQRPARTARVQSIEKRAWFDLICGWKLLVYKCYVNVNKCSLQWLDSVWRNLWTACLWFNVSWEAVACCGLLCVNSMDSIFFHSFSHAFVLELSCILSDLYRLESVCMGNTKMNQRPWPHLPWAWNQKDFRDLETGIQNQPLLIGKPPEVRNELTTWSVQHPMYPFKIWNSQISWFCNTAWLEQKSRNTMNTTKYKYT